MGGGREGGKEGETINTFNIFTQLTLEHLNINREQMYLFIQHWSTSFAPNAAYLFAHHLHHINLSFYHNFICCVGDGHAMACMG